MTKSDEKVSGGGEETTKAAAEAPPSAAVQNEGPSAAKEEVGSTSQGGGDSVDKASLYPFRKARKVAVMVSFCGKNYLGMQRYVGYIVDRPVKLFYQTIISY